MFSEKEPARKSEKRLRRKYPDAEFLIMSGYGHAGFQALELEKYAEYIRSIIER
ncbi:MAG: hypothetical protein K6G18_11575 [Treponema sp.]|nr:hypothetical protein [Treponema sp.]